MGIIGIPNWWIMIAALYLKGIVKGQKGTGLSRSRRGLGYYLVTAGKRLVKCTAIFECNYELQKWAV